MSESYEVSEKDPTALAVRLEGIIRQMGVHAKVHIRFAEDVVTRASVYELRTWLAYRGCHMEFSRDFKEGELVHVR